MTKLRNAVIACGALALAGIGTGASAGQPGFGVAHGASAPRAAPSMPRMAPAVPHFAPSAPRAAAPSAPPRFAPAPAFRNFGNVQPRFVPPGFSANRHVRTGAPFVPNAPQVIPKAPPAAALSRHAPRDHRGRHFAGRYPYLPYGYRYAYPYFYGYGAGLAVPYVSGGYLIGNGAYGVCFRLLQKFRDTGASKWRRRYDKCLAGDYSQLDYLS